MTLPAGMRLGRYEVLDLIGAGGMGEVYRARDTRLDRTVAVKTMRAESIDPGQRTRFEREARAIAALTHPHICTLYDVGHDQAIEFIVMELLEGETLAARLEKGPLATVDALRCAIQIADALDAAHRLGIVHRDLKPSNVMLTRSGAKLLDFGLAKHGADVVPPAEGVTQAAPLTSAGQILGTLAYMAPEQLESKPIDQRTDIFAFGAIVFEMITGQRAFAGSSQASLIGAILHTSPPPITRVMFYVQPFPTTGAKWQVSKNGGQQPQWRRDGGELFFIAPDRKLMAVDVKRGSDFVIGDARPLMDTRITGWDRSNYGVDYAATADGQRFLVNTASETVPPITLVLNWPAATHKQGQ